MMPGGERSDVGDFHGNVTARRGRDANVGNDVLECLKHFDNRVRL